jgi:hypothetical protein
MGERRTAVLGRYDDQREFAQDRKPRVRFPIAREFLKTAAPPPCRISISTI